MQFDFPSDFVTASNVSPVGHVVRSVDNYLWIPIVGGILAFAMAWGIGANDVANAFATSVGAGSLSLRWACVIAAVMEFLGALLMGGSVTSTVRKKIIEGDVFDPAKGGDSNGPEILMTGFLVALISATFWLVVATYFSLPVSTTHSIIGSLVGVGLAYRGGSAVVWISDSSSFFGKLKGVVGVIVSWFVSPVLSALLAVLMFLLVRTLVLRRNDSFQAGLMFMPLFYGITIAVTLFFIIYKGDKRFNIDDILGTGGSVGVALGGGVLVAIVSWFLIVPAAKKWVERWEAREAEFAENPELKKAAEEKEAKVDSALAKVGINMKIDSELDEDVLRIHENVEKFDPKTERLFTWVQIFTAAFDAFAHGANDVANAIAPFTSIYQLYRNNGQISEMKKSKFGGAGTYDGGRLAGKSYAEDDLIPDHQSFCGTDADKNKYYSCKINFPFENAGIGKSEVFSKYTENEDTGKYEVSGEGTCYETCREGTFAKYTSNKQDVPLWILALGGAGIVLGLAMWGYRIIVAIGVKLTKLTPSRGFSIEIGAAITVILASRIGIPVSTTHCQVGATVGVGVVELKSSTVNWKQFIFICFGWVFTVVFTGMLAAGIFSILVYSPTRFGKNGEGMIDYCPGNELFLYNNQTGQFQGIICSGFKPV